MKPAGQGAGEGKGYEPGRSRQGPGMGRQQAGEQAGKMTVQGRAAAARTPLLEHRLSSCEVAPITSDSASHGLSSYEVASITSGCGTAPISTQLIKNNNNNMMNENNNKNNKNNKNKNNSNKKKKKKKKNNSDRGILTAGTSPTPHSLPQMIRSFARRSARIIRPVTDRSA